jgi:hypothetical protein
MEHHQLAHLFSLKAFAELQRGDWDAALETAASVEETSIVHLVAAQVRASIAGWRDGPTSALALLEPDAARRAPGNARLRILQSAILAEAYARVGDRDRVRAVLGQVRETVDPFPRASDEVSPRSAMGGQALAVLVVAAVSVDDAALLDEIEAEIRPSGLAARAQANVQAGRAILAGDTATAARVHASELDAAERLGLSAVAHQISTQLGSFALARGDRLGPEWRPLLQRARAFATKVRAPYWLSELDRLEAAVGESSPAR